MQRDKRGRFVKKAEGGTSLVSPTVNSILINGTQRELLPGATEAFSAYQKNHGSSIKMEDWLKADGSKYLKPLVNPNDVVIGGPNINTWSSIPGVPRLNSTDLSLETPTQNPLGFQLQTPSWLTPVSAADVALGNTAKIPFYYEGGKRFDMNGNPISDMDYYANRDKYEARWFKPGTLVKPEGEQTPESETDPDKTEEVVLGDPSAGMKLFNDKVKEKMGAMGINKTRLADFLEFARAGLGASINNKIAERALKAEVPFLQDVSESHRSVYGDYNAVVQGEKAAAKLRNLASKPITSDGALQQQMMLEAQIQGQQYIDQGRAKDDALIKQTKEVAWQQNKENQQQRQAVAMQNRQAMLATAKNKSQIENMRDSANYSQVVAPLLMGIEQRIRSSAAEQKQYQEYFDKQAIHNDVWTSYDTGLTSEQIELRDIYNSGGFTAIDDVLTKDSSKRADWNAVLKILGDEETRRFAALKGVTYRTSTGATSSSDMYGHFSGDSGYGIFSKKGGTIYKARLTKRTRDNDRAAKTIESSKKIAARFLEKALDSLYTYDSVELVAKPERKKRKYQAGGGLPFVNFAPVFATSETGAGAMQVESSKKGSEKDDEGLISKDIKELLSSLDPLPIDMLMIERELVNFENLSALSPTGEVPSSVLTSRYFNILSRIKIAKFNREEYTQAFNQLKGNGGLNEFAVTSEGYLIGTNGDGDFQMFSADQVNKGVHKEQGYNLITNSNLLYLRANSPEGAFDHKLISVAQNGIGMEVITKQVNEILQSLGTSKNSEEGFVQMGTEGSIKAGLQFLQKAAKAVGDDGINQNMSVADYYQAGYLTEDQAQQAQLAIEYIKRALPANAQALLQVKGGSDKGAEALLSSLVLSKTSSSTSFKATPKKMAGSGSGSGGSRGSGGVDGLDLSPAQMLQRGYGQRESILIQDSSSAGIHVDAITMPITKDGNKPIGSGTLEDVAESQFGGVLDFTNASMGGNIIPFEGRRNIALDGSKIYSMYLPVDQEEYATTGNIVPDIALIDKVNEILKVVREQQISDVDTVNAMFEEAGLPAYMNANGTVNPTVYKRFGVINGTALDNAFGSSFVQSRYLKEIDDEDIINGAISIMNQGRSKEDRVEYDAKSFLNFGGLFGDYDTIYQGTIFIPISNDAFAGIAGSGSDNTITDAQALELEAIQQQHERIQTYKNPGQLR